jgi:hypothetical protein
MNYLACRVCGLIHDEDDAPWGDDGRQPTFNFCECCGVEFGYGDSSYEGVKRWRRRWLSQGAKWREPEARPSDWNVVEQLENVSPDQESYKLAVALVQKQARDDRSDE